jgi:hypothetical protein
LDQLKLFPNKCDEHEGFVSAAVIPQGLYCTNCEEIVWQYMLPNSPLEDGYITANYDYLFNRRNDVITKFGEDYYYVDLKTYEWRKREWDRGDCS